MYPGIHAKTSPTAIAQTYVPSGHTITWAELDAGSNRLAHLLRRRGLTVGDGVVVLMGNRPPYLDITWAAQRSGLYYTTLSPRLTAEEDAYIIGDCGAKALVVEASAPAAAELLELCPGVEVALVVGGELDGYESYDDAVAGMPTTPVDDETDGRELLYSSGTTGRPKGIKRPLTGLHPAELQGPLRELFQGPHYDIGPDTVYLSTAPLYHSAPIVFSMMVQRLGGQVVTLEKFDPELAVETIDRYRITHSQWVPTMFVRMLRLPDEVKARYEGGTHRIALHAAAPCPVNVKEQMLGWWGPIINEYYSCTEMIGSTFTTAEEWLAHPGTVGRAVMGELHILGEDHRPVPAGVDGEVWFSGGPTFEYHNDPDKTAKAYDAQGWATVGDLGHVDAEGYLYLTDRKNFTIISGGVNIYPQEIENVLIGDPRVLDVAVFGIPNEEFGEEVKAVVQPVDGVGDDGLRDDLLALCREKLAGYKQPRSLDFRAELPRDPNGKLYKRHLRDEYLKESA